MIRWLGTRPYERQVLVVYVIALFMSIIDGTMVNVALPKMARDFGVDPSQAEWIAVGYLLAVASVIPAAGWLADRFGSKRVFLVSLVAFIATSLLCGLAQSLDQLVVFRVLQGLGGGLLAPIGSAMLFRAFPLSERVVAATAVMSVAVVAPAAGPLLGGILVDQASWHWIFLINVPIGVIAVWLSARVLREDVSPLPGRIDLVGLLLGSGSVALLLYTLSIGPERGWTAPSVLVLGAIGLVAMAVMIAFELMVDEPMLALRLFRDRLFGTVNLAAALIYAGFFGQFFVLAIYLQSLRGFSAFESGLGTSPQAIGMMVVANLFGARAYRRVGPRRLMGVGTAFAALITCAFGLVELTTPLAAVMALSFVRGLAMGFVFIAMQTAVFATTSHADTARASSLFNAQRQISYAFGIAVAATVLASGVRGRADAPAIERLAAHQHALLAVGLLMIPGAFVSWFIRDDDVAETRGLAPVGATVAE